ncbi:Factor arrest protein 11 [Agyrium rufum]|nr:Factor arrest protein 11 [Agyrium rufum]
MVEETKPAPSTEEIDEIANPSLRKRPAPPPMRPLLRREGSAPRPPDQPPPPAPLPDENTGMDSLNLGQLQRLLVPNPVDFKTYAYTYEDARSFEEEIEEWFQYTEEDAHMILGSRDSFEDQWQQFTQEVIGETRSWPTAETSFRTQFLQSLLRGMDSDNIMDRLADLETTLYLAFGAWAETSGRTNSELDKHMKEENTSEKYRLYSTQVHWMYKNCRELAELGFVTKLYTLMESISFPSTENGTMPTPNGVSAADTYSALRQETNLIMSLLYVLCETARVQMLQGDDLIATEFRLLKPSLSQHLSDCIAHMRFEDTVSLPLTRTLLLLWKALRLDFGTAEELDGTKASLAPDERQLGHDKAPYIMTSPLDYHLFRQEITSKYPAFNPPPPLVPIEPENNSILPPLPRHSSRRASLDSLIPATALPLNGNTQSIFHQPVHISTPAPSPPPSPSLQGGKAQKKQNYQTNQNFPFLYPPLGDSTNTLGGKGSTQQQDLLVGRRWEGSDIPASILEAGELFASRMRMSRAVRQLWEVREQYVRFERGWEDSEVPKKASAMNFVEFDDLLDENQTAEMGNDHALAEHPPKETETGSGEPPIAAHREPLKIVSKFYRDSLPQLQSFVIVLLKVFLSHVTKLAAAPANESMVNADAQQSVDGSNNSINRKPELNVDIAEEIGISTENASAKDDNPSEQGLQRLNALRVREITSRAIAGVLLTLLRWFKLSHVLQFEYLSQLLLDSNYFAIALKYFQYQNLEQVLDIKMDREELDFFQFCHSHSNNAPPSSPPPLANVSSCDSSEDEAQPPPISRTRPARATSSPPYDPASPSSNHFDGDPDLFPHELEPNEPITTFNPRLFYTAITHLRLIHKITKRKAHRALLLVQYKSGVVLKKPLRIGQQDMHLYTLKVYKAQVPYCGRKWRSSNMNVITEIYLNCKPELRDEWLASSDLENTIADAVPLEQALRSLVHWWHLREYRDVMGESGVGNGGIQREIDADDFFTRELEKMGYGIELAAEEDDPLAEEDVGVPQHPSEWDGGPLNGEGW